MRYKAKNILMALLNDTSAMTDIEREFLRDVYRYGGPRDGRQLETTIEMYNKYVLERE